MVISSHRITGSSSAMNAGSSSAMNARRSRSTGNSSTRNVTRPSPQIRQRQRPRNQVSVHKVQHTYFMTSEILGNEFGFVTEDEIKVFVDQDPSVETLRSVAPGDTVLLNDYGQLQQVLSHYRPKPRPYCHFQHAGIPSISQKSIYKWYREVDTIVHNQNYGALFQPRTGSPTVNSTIFYRNGNAVVHIIQTKGATFLDFTIAKPDGPISPWEEFLVLHKLPLLRMKTALHNLMFSAGTYPGWSENNSLSRKTSANTASKTASMSKRTNNSRPLKKRYRNT